MEEIGSLKVTAAREQESLKATIAELERQLQVTLANYNYVTSRFDRYYCCSEGDNLDHVHEVSPVKRVLYGETLKFKNRILTCVVSGLAEGGA